MDLMKKENLKKLLTPSFYLLVGAVGLLLMLLNYAVVNYKVVSPSLYSFISGSSAEFIGFSAYDAISFGDGSIKSILAMVFLPFSKEVGAPFLLTALSIAFIAFAAVCALLVIVGVIGIVSALFNLDPFAKLKLNALDIGTVLTRVQVVLLVACDLLFVFGAFFNLYSLVDGSFVGLKPAAGFYVLTGIFALAFVVHELYVRKSDEKN